MHDRLSLIERDVAAHPNHFVLTVDRNLLVHFALRIKPSQRRSVHRSNSGEIGTGNVVLPRKLQQSEKRLISLVKDNSRLLRRFSRDQQLNLHPGSFALRAGIRRRYSSYAVFCLKKKTLEIAVQLPIYLR